MAALDVSPEAQERLLKEATVKVLCTSLFAKVDLDPIRDARFNFSHFSIADDILPAISSPRPIFLELQSRIGGLNKSEVGRLLDDIKAVFEFQPVLGREFVLSFFEIVVLLSKRLAFFELQEKGADTISGDTSDAVKASVKL